MYNLYAQKQMANRFFLGIFSGIIETILRFYALNGSRSIVGE